MRFWFTAIAVSAAIVLTVAYMYIRGNGLLQNGMALKERYFDCLNRTINVDLHFEPGRFALKPMTLGQYLFHAAMIGPQGEHFSCFLEWEGEGYSCKDLQYLDHGVWKVEIILVRTCCKSAACLRHGGGPFSVLEYAMEQQTTMFEDFQLEFKYPYTKLLNFEWNATGSHKLPVLLGRKCTHGSRGVWRPFVGRCTLPGCRGTIDSDLLHNEVNAKRGMHHTFSPFACSYYWFSRSEALQCLSAKRPVLVGDSRMRQLGQHAAYWLGTNLFDSIKLEFPHHLGLPLLLKSSLSAELFVAVANKRVVLMNSMVHDLADFGHFSKSISTVDYRFFWNMTGCNACNKTLAADCNCARKHGALQEYLMNVQRLGKFLQQALELAGTKGDSKLFWVSQHRNPPFQHAKFFSWQTHDFLLDLEDQAASLLDKVPVHRLDLRPHLMAAPLAWWDDTMHYGHRLDSFFHHATLQVILNHICSVPV
jgi:hypothetical protein